MQNVFCMECLAGIALPTRGPAICLKNKKTYLTLFKHYCQDSIVEHFTSTFSLAEMCFHKSVVLHLPEEI